MEALIKRIIPLLFLASISFGQEAVKVDTATGQILSPLTILFSGATLDYSGATVIGLAGAGTVTNFSAGTLSPLFTTSVSNPTSVPDLTFSLSNAGARTVFGNNTGSTGAPSYSSAPQFLKIGNLTSNGNIVTSGGDGTLGIDTATYTPTSRTLTIAGTALDLSANRAWTLDTITGLSTAGLVKRTGANALAIAVPKTDFWDNSDFVGSGIAHAHGLVPDPGASSGISKFLREDGTWNVPSGVGTVTSIGTTAPVTGGPITSTGTIGLAFNPTGGTTGQALIKASNTDYDFTWGAGGGGGSAATKQDVGDADATITAGVTVINLTTTLTASRVITLPACSSYGPLNPLVIVDPKGVTNTTHTISVRRAGSDTINGGTTNVVVLGADEAGGAVTLLSDGSSKWTTIARGGGSRMTGYIDGLDATSSNILIANGTGFFSRTLTGSGATISISTTGTLTIDNILNASLQNSTMTLAGNSVGLGGSLGLDAITGVSSNGYLKRTATNNLTNVSSIPNADLANSTITIGGTSTALGGSVLGNVTNDTQTKSAIVPNTAPSAGQILAGNAGGTAYAPVTLSGSGATATLSSAGVLTLSSIANATLANSSITIGGTSTALGGSVLGNVTDDVQTKASIVPNTAPSAGQILAGNAGGTAYAPVTLSGSGATATLSSSGVLTLSGIANATLANSTITIGGTSTALGGSVLGNVTNDAQTKAAVVPNTAPSSGQILIGNAGGTAYAKQTLSGSGATATLSDAGVLTLSAIANATLSNSAITIAGTSTALGGTITIDTITGVSSNGFLTRTGTNTLTNTTAPSGTVVGTTDTQTLTNKRVNPRTHSTSSATSWTPDSDAYDEEIQTALAGACTINAPSGTPVEGQKLVLRIKDNGTARALSFATGSSGTFRFSTDLAAPTTTVISKTFYLGFMWNATDSRWDNLAQLNNF